MDESYFIALCCLCAEIGLPGSVVASVVAALVAALAASPFAHLVHKYCNWHCKKV